MNGLYNGDPKTGEYASKFVLNSGITLGSGAIPVVGWTFGAIYFIGEAVIPKDENGIGGWEKAMESSQQNFEENRKIDPTWNARPGGGLL